MILRLKIKELMSRIDKNIKDRSEFLRENFDFSCYVPDIVDAYKLAANLFL